MPGIPGRAALLRVRAARARRCTSALLAATALVAALYPMRIVARLPIAATLRNEVIGDVTRSSRRARDARVFAMPAGPGDRACATSRCDIAAGDYIADARAVRLRQVDAAAHARLRRYADRAARCCSTGTTSRRSSDAERSLLRLRQIGFVFQRFFLLPMLTAWENVELPQVGSRRREAGAARSARASCSTTSASPRARDHRPSQLSGGEMQRVAIARALANRPRLLLADEPTGELDRRTGEQIAALLDRVNADGTALVIVTHDPALAERARRVADDARRPRRRTTCTR